jgi:signal transduction histidine kinase
MTLLDGMKGRRNALFTKQNTLLLKFICFLAISLILLQTLFYYLQFSQVDLVKKGIQGVLRKGLNETDQYDVSKTIRDLEYLKLFECSVLISPKLERKIYLNLRGNKKCKESYLSLNGLESVIDLRTLNGAAWELQFKSINAASFHYSLWISRFLTILLSFLIFWYLYNKINLTLLKAKKEREYSEELSRNARQLSHDIRSPLAALNMGLADISLLPESSRVILKSSSQRIQDIANNLLQSSRDNDSSHSSETTNTLLFTLLEEIMSEKRLEYRLMADIKIEDSLTEGIGCFTQINTVEMKRIISNMINNSIESFEDDKGEITVNLKRMNESCLIEVVDSGKGIPASVIDKIGKREGFSFGKKNNEKSGSGIGLFHAFQTIESWNGSYEIVSEVGKGTTIKISLPISKKSQWYIDDILLVPNHKIIVLDDDKEIHLVWDQVFSNFVNKSEISLTHFYTLAEARNYFKKNSVKDTLFLCDYDFVDVQENGAEIIEELGISEKSILVTGNYFDKKIQKRCSEMGLKILPKRVAPYVRIGKASSFKTGIVKNKAPIINAVYVEDDPFLRMAWELSAKKNEVHLLVVESPEMIMSELENLSKLGTDIYIDQNFENSKTTGISLANDLKELGFQKLFLATGYTATDLNIPPWLKLVGKESPWTH